MFNLSFINQIEDAFLSAEVNRKISPNDAMQNQWYDDVGRSAVEVIKGAISTSYISSVNRVLDLPCGHGRVLRYLRAMFPSIPIDACDLDKDGVDFCVSTFGATAIYSSEDLTQVDFPNTYDLIWVGSLFSHTSKDTTKKWMVHLSKFLSERGIIIATLIGRKGISIHKRVPYIAEKRWNKILADYNDFGYGYCDYEKEENHEYISGSYGISLAKPSVVVEIIEKIPNVRLYSFTECAWADHQDVVVFGKPSFNVHL